MDATILITSPRELRIKRIISRDSQRSLEQIENIISRQMAVEEAKVKADYVIINDDSTLLIPQVLEIHSVLLKKC